MEDFNQLKVKFDSLLEAMEGKKGSNKGRDLSPASNSGNDIQFVDQTEPQRRPIHERLGRKPTSTAVPAYDFSDQPAVHGRFLPAVTAEMKAKMEDVTQFVDLNELLGVNRAPVNSSRKPPVFTHDANGNLSISTRGGRRSITTFVEYVSAFTIFMGYRVAQHPALAIPMSRYLDVMGRMADGREHRTWLLYDELHRMHMAAHPDDVSLWTRRHEESYLEAEREYAPTSSHHHDSVSRVSRQNDQPFRTEPATDGQICYQFNSGNCKSEPCKSGRKHVCRYCGGDHQGRNCNQRFTNHSKPTKHST